MSNISYPAIKTIIFREIKNYLKEFQINIIAPLINTILLVFILSTINKFYNFGFLKDSYMYFLIPGIIMTVVMQTSFIHLSQVIISMKQIGSFDDYLVSPISREEIFISFMMSSIFVCLIVAIINIIFLSFFIEFEKIYYFSLVYYLILGIIIFSSIGAIIGFLSFTWDFQSSVSNFFIIPASFFSGTFFSIDSLDSKYKFLLEYNPLYYLVSGFRNSFIQDYQINLFNELYILFVSIAIFIFALFIFKKGYRVIS